MHYHFTRPPIAELFKRNLTTTHAIEKTEY